MIQRSIKIINFLLENYNPLYESLGIDKFEFDRKDSVNNIVLIIGRNGSGKTFILNELTPLPLEHIANRSSNRIIPGKDGRKKITFLVDNYLIYICEIFYPAEKKTQCFLTKIDLHTNKKEELNSNGNVNSYLELLEAEFGLIKNYTNIGFFSDDVKNIVEMTPSERYNLISVWLPNISEPLNAYKIGIKTYNAMKKEVESLSIDINKITVEEYQNELNKNNFALIDRDKRLQYVREKLSEGKLYFNKVKDINSSYINNIFHEFKSRNNDHNIQMKTIENIVNEMKEYKGKKGKDKLSNDIIKYKEIFITNKSKLDSIENELTKLKFTIDDLTPQITEDNKQYSLIDITNNISNIKTSIDEFIKEKKILEKENKEYCYSPEDPCNKNFQILLSLLYDIYHIIQKIKLLLQKYSISDILGTNAQLISLIENKEEREKNKLKILNEKILEKENRIYLLQNNGLGPDILNKAPKGCTPRDCPVLQELFSFIKPDAEISQLSSELTHLKEEYDNTKLNIEDNIQSEKNNIHTVLSLIDDINNSIFRNKEMIAAFPKEIIKQVNTTIEVLVNNIEYVIEYIKNWDMYISLCNKIDEYKKSIDSLNNIKSLILINDSKKTELEKFYNQYQELSNKRAELITSTSSIKEKLDILESLQIKFDSVMTVIDEFNTESNTLVTMKTNILRLNKLNYYKEHIEDILSKFNREETEILNDISSIKNNINDIQTKIASRETLEKRRNDLIKRMEKYEILLKTWSPRVGYPSFIIQGFLDNVKDVTNRDLSNLWGGVLYIKDFILNNNEFSIIIQKGNTTIEDASMCSRAERATLNMALSMSIIEVNSKNMLYNIVRLDETDSSFDEKRRQFFLDMITSRLESINCSNCFIVTHNKFFENIPTDVILLPEHGCSNESLQNKNVLVCIE